MFADDGWLRGWRICRKLLPVVLTVLSAAACGGGGSDGGSDEPPLLTLLGAIPDTEESSNYIAYSDLDAYYAALGVDAPPEDASTEEFLQWATPVLAQDPESIELPERFPVVELTELVRQAFVDAGAFRDEIGVDPAHISQSLQAGQPPRQYYVFGGDFDRGGIDGAVRSEPNFSDLLEEASYEGVDYYTWGEDGQVNFSRTSSVRRLGGGGRLAVHQDLLLWSYSTDGMKGMIDATKGAKSLAERDDIRALAEAADARGVYAFEMYGFSDSSGTEGTILGPYSAIAHGAGADAEGAFAILIVTHDNEESAEDNADRIRTQIEETTDGLGRSWSEFADSIDVIADGVLTIATFHGPDVPWPVPLGVVVPRER